ncbi:MAG: hypothetical protein ACRELZ_12510 [Candidatus Rokuibacteriota bacterium]
MAAALLCASAWLAGCASPQWVYEKPGLTPAKLDHDMGLCRREANDPQMVALPGSPRVDREVFNRCMVRRGYTVRPEKSG